ncbi:hypothetical protein ACQR1I_14605 [Bradyrhizobium sp. HKCCYLS2038]|uniref:hypothetical protein n=1 Tax=unclassified Bradyrhizobium TaxID=2631580 RepID=UPI003EB925D8
MANTARTGIQLAAAFAEETYRRGSADAPIDLSKDLGVVAASTAMVRRAPFPSAMIVVLVATSMLVLSPSASFGACKAVVRGELVQALDRQPAYPKKFLFFFLFEITRSGKEELFQSFVMREMCCRFHSC